MNKKCILKFIYYPPLIYIFSPNEIYYNEEGVACRRRKMFVYLLQFCKFLGKNMHPFCQFGGKYAFSPFFYPLSIKNKNINPCLNSLFSFPPLKSPFKKKDLFICIFLKRWSIIVYSYSIAWIYMYNIK